ncbi:MAG: porin [Pseudomonadota bacterium]
MKIKPLIVVLFLVLAFLFAPPPGICPAAGDQALEELLKVLEKKETLSPEEAEGLKKLLREKQAREAKPAAPTGKEEDGVTLRASFKDGFRLSAADPGMFSLTLGGLLQTDYRYYDFKNENPGWNKFDVRRARVIFQGRTLKYIGFKISLEFEGTNSRNLLDGYVDISPFDFLKLRAGQFKEPFGLESNIADSGIFFAERSMGYDLTPQRDVGAMLHGSAWGDRINYGAGAFNGDGRDGATSGDEDEPQAAGRLVLSPFRGWAPAFLDSFQVGGSYGYGRIDRTDVSVKVRTTGQTEFFNVASTAKFKVIQDAGIRNRYGLEAAWACGPVLVMGEWVRLHFRDIKTSSDKFDLILDDYYAAALVMLTGEQPVLKGGLLQAVKPRRGLWDGGFGAVGLGARYDVFQADDKVYERVINKGDSIKKAAAYSGSLTWFLTDQARLLVDFTRSEFDARLLIHRDAFNNTAFYCDREDVVTVRLTFEF